MVSQFLINSRRIRSASARLTYNEVIELAGFRRDAVVSVTVSDPETKRDWILSPNQSLELRDFLIVNACDTSNA